MSIRKMCRQNVLKWFHFYSQLSILFFTLGVDSLNHKFLNYSTLNHIRCGFSEKFTFDIREKNDWTQKRCKFWMSHGKPPKKLRERCVHQNIVFYRGICNFTVKYFPRVELYITNIGSNATKFSTSVYELWHRRACAWIPSLDYIVWLVSYSKIYITWWDDWLNMSFTVLQSGWT